MAALPDPNGPFPFILSSNALKVDPATRKLIRSHVMRGKKQKKYHASQQPRPSSGQAILERTHIRRVKLEEITEVYSPLIPIRVGSDLSFSRFPAHVEPSILLNVAKITSFTAKVMFPLMVSMGFQVDNNEWRALIAEDAAALHITIFALESFVDRVLRRQVDVINLKASLHFQTGLSLLRERLLGNEEEIKVSDSTIGVVVKLANAAHFDGDDETAKHHMRGLRKMVDLRGGLDFFQGKQLLWDILRLDLSIALLSPSLPVFYVKPFEPALAYPEKLMPASGGMMSSLDNDDLMRRLDDELSIAWLVMRKFSLLVNLGTITRRLIRPNIILETMVAVMYRLLRMVFTHGSVNEGVRLGLLAYSHHLFLQWQDIKPLYDHFPNVYRHCIQKLKMDDGTPLRLMLWLLLTGAISVFKVSDEPWLLENLQGYSDRCEIHTWKEMQEMLKSFMWIGLVDFQNVADLRGIFPDHH